MIRFEHFALNLKEPHEIADWYAATLGCQVLLRMDQQPHTVFLADARGRVFWEIYHNPQAPLSQVTHCDPLVFHGAFAVDFLQRQGLLCRFREPVLQAPPHHPLLELLDQRS
jgi:hypothetical protein